MSPLPPNRRQKKKREPLTDVPDQLPEQLPTPLPVPLTRAAPDAPDDGLDDADALPAVGRVWDDGPKRSLGEILAASNRQRQQAAPVAPPAPAKHDPLAGTPTDLANIWPAAMQQVQETLGSAVHVPLLSGEPRRDGSQITVRFGGAFTVMTRYIERYREQIQKIISQVAGEEMLLRLEVDENAPAAVQTRPAPPIQGNMPRQAESAAPAAPTMPPAKEAIPLTPELRAELEKDPLIRAVLEQLGGAIVKVE